MRNPEIRKIQYKGLSTSPDGYLCPDGELAGAMGVENLTGALTSASRYQPKKITLIETSTGDEAYVVYIHKLPSGKEHIIIAYVSGDTTTWYWKDVSEGYPERIEVEGGKLKDVNDLFMSDEVNPEIKLSDVTNIHASGNTLMILAGDIHYLLFKADGDDSEVKEAHYHSLGNHLPEIPVYFGLHSQLLRAYDGYDPDSTLPENSSPYNVTGLTDQLGNPTDGTIPIITEGNRTLVTSAIMAKVNMLVKETSDKGYFCLPFLVRYALKLYNGEITMHSAPVYMPVSDITDNCGGIWPVLDGYNNSRKEFQFHIDYTRADLVYHLGPGAYNTLRQWSDIVKGIEIYASAPLYTYNPAEAITNIIGGKRENNQPGPDSFYAKEMPRHRTIAKQAFSGQSGKYKYRDILSVADNRYTFKDAAYSDAYKYYVITQPSGREEKQTQFYYPLWVFQLAQKKVSDYWNEVRDTSNFYLLKSVDSKDLLPNAIAYGLELDNGYLTNLVAHPAMTDEYQSHDTLNAKVSYMFNGRLNLGGVSRKLYKNFDLKMLIPYQTAGVDLNDIETVINEDISMTIEISEDGASHVVKSNTVNLPYSVWWKYLYYPNTGVKRIWVGHEPLNIGTRSYDAQEHSGLNGSVALDGRWANTFIREGDIATEPPQETNGVAQSPTKLYTSDPYNPWVYESTNINTVGTGEILALSSAAKALTDAQFSGSHLYSMYIFTSQGIWGVKPSETGGWGPPEPITRDVVSVPKAVLQIDDAVVFPTARGIMLLQGVDTVVLSEMLSDHSHMKVSEMPGMRRLLLNPELTDLANIFLADGTEPEQITDEALDEFFTPDPRTYFDSQQLRLLFDYTNQRIVACRRDKQYSLILSLDSKQWSAAPWQLVYKPESYPDCYVMLKTLSDHYILTNLSDRSGDAGLDDDYFVPQNGFIITRPIKIEGLQDALKELESVVHQGRFGRTKVKVIVYGTMDYKKWYLVASSTNADIYRSHGQYYRAFAIALLLDLDQYDYLDTVTLQLEPRRTGRLHGMGYK